ncbi:MAG: hypothetical protein COB35_11055 [Gammaproteobacteria bacterium]|nr:MAG: hypothetical protein COB35_11055 [Gammaproteobacteria bacterium]
MIRLLSVFLFINVCFFSINSNATIIPLNNYIQYDQNNNGVADFDIVWASSWAFQFYGCDGVISNQTDYLTTLYTGPVSCSNQLFAAGYPNDNWLFFEQIGGLDISEVTTLFNNGAFNDTVNGGYKTAFSFWNTDVNILPAVNPFTLNPISDWTALLPVGINPFTSGNKYFSNVFYARKSQTQPVPEPATILIFAIALLALSVRSRKQA